MAFSPALTLQNHYLTRKEPLRELDALSLDNCPSRVESSGLLDSHPLLLNIFLQNLLLTLTMKMHTGLLN